MDIHWQHIYQTSNNYFLAFENKIKQINEKITCEVVTLEEKESLLKIFDKEAKIMKKIEEILSLAYHR